MKHLILITGLLMSLHAFAGGTHSHSHNEKKPEKSTCTPEHASMGHCTTEEEKTEKDNTCTPEHAAMGHCKMDSDHDKHSDAAHSDHKHASGVGKPGISKDAFETVQVDMLDSMRFEFKDKFTIKPGKTISFVATNKGAIDHEFSIGNEAEQQDHAKMMMANPTMQHGDGEAAITVKPGQTKTLTWTFADDETVVFACTLPGHYQSGMLYKQNIVS